MTNVTLSAALVNNSHSYNLTIDPQETVGRVARYLSQHEPFVDTGTLEVAHPVNMAQRLQDIDLQTGDRLVVFAEPARQLRPPEQLRPGDRILRFVRGDFAVSSHGKRGLLVGKPDQTEQVIPDVNLRNFVAPEYLRFISRGCMWLTYEDDEKRWYAAKLGETRILIDEYELGPDKIPLDGNRLLRLYRAADDPTGEQVRPLTEIALQVETVQPNDDLVYLQPGEGRLRVNIGTERDRQTLRASVNIPMGQLATSVAVHNGAPMNAQLRLYALRLLPPNATVENIALPSENFLYIARSDTYAHSLLSLRDVHDDDRVFTLSGGLADDEKTVACRLADVNLCPEKQPPLTALLEARARLRYTAAESAWWVRLEDGTALPLFVNNARATSANYLRLATGDVLSFGTSVEDYALRLTVDITADNR